MNMRMLKVVKLVGFHAGDAVNLALRLDVAGLSLAVDSVLGKDEIVMRIRGDGTLEIFAREWV